MCYFNPRSPGGERPAYSRGHIHSVVLFQSTLPVWGATCKSSFFSPFSQGISIHAPRVGSDSLEESGLCLGLDFNPRSPCGERQEEPPRPAKKSKFQSTLPVWGATLPSDIILPHSQISIHAPRVGSDVVAALTGCFFSEFQSTLPVWGATRKADFSPHPTP